MACRAKPASGGKINKVVLSRVAPDIRPAGYPAGYPVRLPAIRLAGYPARNTLHGRYILSSKPRSPLNITINFENGKSY